MDTLANALNAIKVAEAKGRAQAKVKPASKLVKEVLSIMQQEGFIQGFEFIDDGKSGEILVRLVGKINNVGVVKPRLSLKKGEWEKWEQRYLPARDVGRIIVSTPKGITTHVKAKQEGAGGRLLAFVY
jgi:small subunit ribosomal protein S8